MTLGRGLLGEEGVALERQLKVGRDLQEDHLVGGAHVDTILRYFISLCPQIPQPRPVPVGDVRSPNRSVESVGTHVSLPQSAVGRMQWS